MKCPKCGNEDCQIIVSQFRYTGFSHNICPACNVIWTDWQQSSITRLTGFLERIKDGKICRRCIAENMRGFVAVFDEDGNRHSCEREIAREGLE